MKEYNPDTLGRHTKKELVDIICCMQNNYKAMAEQLSQQAENFVNTFEKNRWKPFDPSDLPANKNIMIRFYNGTIAVGSWTVSKFWVNVQPHEWRVIETGQIKEWRELNEEESLSIDEKELFLKRLDATLPHSVLYEKNYDFGKHCLMDIIKACANNEEI